MTPNRTDAFPTEGFVRAAVGRHFFGLEFERSSGEDHYLFSSRDGVRWMIVPIGLPDDPELAFHKGLGRLLAQADAGPRVNYVLAMPDAPAYAFHRESVPGWVRERLNLFWFIVDEEGEIAAVTPSIPVRRAHRRVAGSS